MKTPWLVLLAAVVSTGCGGGGGSGANGKVAGTWQRTSGGLYSATGGEILGYLDLAKDGGGEAYGKDGVNALGCHTLQYTVLDGRTLTVQRQNDGDPQLLSWSRSGDTLTLTDATGNPTVFTRVDAVPADAACIVPTLAATFHPAESKRHYSDALVYDGSSLWFEGGDDKIHPIDPATGTEGAALTLSTAAEIGAVVGGNFWALCNCNNADMQLRSPANAKLAELDLQSLGVTGYRVNNLASDGSFLWINLRIFVDERSHLLKVDSAGQPSSVLSNTPFDFYLNGMTFHNSHLWAVNRDRLVQINPATMTVTATAVIPPAGGNWTGIASTGTDLFLLGEDVSFHTVILDLTGVP